MKYKILKIWYKLLGRTPADMPMVRYWKTRDSVQAKTVKKDDGSVVMYLEGEDYPISSFPRGYLLMSEKGDYPPFSKLKHHIKNKVFNESWKKLDKKIDNAQIIKEAKTSLWDICSNYLEELKFDMVPQKVMPPPVREIYRAFTIIGETLSEDKRQKFYKLRDCICLIMHEDDAYRFRVQWIMQFFNPNSFLQKIIRFLTRKSYEETLTKQLKTSLELLEHAEVIGDMKERIRLLRRVILLALEDKEIMEVFVRWCKELDFKKVLIREEDKYHFRGKYFKVDYLLFDY